ncbi:DUF1016 N-terminal domain-containing protein [Nostoc sp. UHCC 0251]|uniref:DUF1016 N-terminal domain-containing protein n=1 Tax=Nostoc sp. UHCC 0251 TaxID=3110240 RepID=UPI002B2104EA|nr:DUF1016 N-terminal domain-containing protein [Nostoc sp. UHCC 0251]MEA5625334.1 DUF1016 N-terminal domain-containing protein [Nostoc sp. UHCC 0251]
MGFLQISHEVRLIQGWTNNRLHIHFDLIPRLLACFAKLGKIFRIANSNKVGAQKLSIVLQKAFPEMKGFLVCNLKYMRAFAEAYPEQQLVQQAVALIPWGHSVRILDTIVKDKL